MHTSPADSCWDSCGLSLGGVCLTRSHRWETSCPTVLSMHVQSWVWPVQDTSRVSSINAPDAALEITPHSFPSAVESEAR